MTRAPAPDFHVRYLATPFLWRGSDPSGWDCQGLVSWVRREDYGLPAPDYSGLYSDADGLLSRADRAALQERLVRAEMGAWRRVERRPGAVVLLNVLGRPVHMGVCLTGGRFLHALRTAGTLVEELDAGRWSGKVEGFYDRDA